MGIDRVSRRATLTSGVAGLLTLSHRGAFAQAALPPSPVERSLGNSGAPVTVIKYFSLSCGNCARFHTQILPRIKQEYVDTGKVRLVFRDYPLDQAGFDAATLAHCAGADRYHGFLQALFHEKESWAHAKEYLPILARFGQIGGVSAEQFTACRESKAFTDPILKMAVDGRQTFKVSATPTFFVADKMHVGVIEFDQFAKIVDPLLPK
jgi:protein-disulfide isomerase